MPETLLWPSSRNFIHCSYWAPIRVAFVIFTWSRFVEILLLFFFFLNPVRTKEKTHGRAPVPRRCCPSSRCLRHTSSVPGCSGCSCRRTLRAGTEAGGCRTDWLWRRRYSMKLQTQPTGKNANESFLKFLSSKYKIHTGQISRQLKIQIKPLTLVLSKAPPPDIFCEHYLKFSNNIFWRDKAFYSWTFHWQRTLVHGPLILWIVIPTTVIKCNK